MIVSTLESRLKSAIRDVPDFPKKGILFRDITTLLRDPALLRESIDAMAADFCQDHIQYVVGIESRGFIFGAALAIKLGAGFIPVRKKGKLPSRTHAVAYQLEYGEDVLEIHEDAIEPGAKVLLSDDLLATGGTAQAVIDLLERLGAKVVGVAFLVELTSLQGRSKLQGRRILSLVQF